MISEYLKQKVDFLLVDPPYKTWSVLNLLNSEYYEWTDAYMSLLVQYDSEWIWYGYHRHRVFSYMQFKDWFDLIRTEEGFRPVEEPQSYKE